MPLATQTDSAFVNSFINQFASQIVATYPNFSPALSSGSVIEALAQAASAIATFCQFQAQYATFFARASTCSGPDLDSFYAQFAFPREGAQTASGQVTLSIASVSPVNLVIPVGTVVQTAGAGIQYALVADTNQSAYNIGLNAYVLPASTVGSPVLSITASVAATVAGSASNVLAGQLTQFATSSYGITSVSNTAPIENGADQETDAQYTFRFILYINSLSKGTYDAILAACLSVFPEFTYNILSNENPEGDLLYGAFVVVANNPGQTVEGGQLTQLLTAINNVRAFTVQAFCVAAVPVTPTIAMNISISAGSDFTAVSTAAQTAIIGYVNSLPSGGKLYLSNLIDIAENSSTEITSVDFTSVLINDAQTDLTVNNFHVIQANIDSVSISQYDG